MNIKIKRKILLFDSVSTFWGCSFLPAALARRLCRYAATHTSSLKNGRSSKSFDAGHIKWQDNGHLLLDDMKKHETLKHEELDLQRNALEKGRPRSKQRW